MAADDKAFMDKLEIEGRSEGDGAEARASMVAGLTEHWHGHPADIPAVQWDALIESVSGGTPFLRHALLRAMVDSNSACARTGWRPHFLTLQDAKGWVWAACPAFIKSHSYGEYVFDWAWADAHDRAFAAQGDHYYPKLLGAVPFSPIPGQRLLTRPEVTPDVQARLRARLLQALQGESGRQGWSSAHALFVSEPEAVEAAQAGWLVRHGVQFHWCNRDPAPYRDFADFLASLHRDKRKKIQQERRKVAEAGVHFAVLAGRQIQTADWDFFFRCYTQTYHERGQQPYLTRAFWLEAGRALPEEWVLFIAERAGERIACALLAVDTVHRIAYGRYWGAIDTVSCLHFEACYYQPLQWCIDHGYLRFEGGAQGEHKLARGLLPIQTYSIHWLADKRFRHAVSDFLIRESHGTAQYIDELDERRPFKPQDQGA